MENTQAIDFESDEVKKAMLDVVQKTTTHVGAGWWDRQKDEGGVSRPLSRSRRRLLAGEGDSTNYHVTSQTVGGEIVFDEVEKESLKTLIWKLARFCRLRVLTYTVMGNHFHVLLEVPDRKKLVEEFTGHDGEKRLLTHMKCMYSTTAVRSLEAELVSMREQGREEDAAAVVESVIARMGDLSHYVKELKQRFTRWYNKRHGRRGTLWMDRFKCVMVENGETLRTMALYIDLNAVRAQLVDNPANYRWCGWAEALGGSRRAKRGICRVMDYSLDHWEQGKTEARDSYAGMLQSILKGSGTGENDPSGSITPTLGNLLLKRVRYFTDGEVIGSKEFVERIYQSNRKQFPAGRKHPSRPWRDPSDLNKRADFGIHTIKDLRLDVYEY